MIKKLQLTFILRLIILCFLLTVCRIHAKIIVFYAPDCEECYAILTDSLLQHLEVKDVAYFNINNIPNYELLLKVEEIHQRRSSDFPVIVSGNRLFFGNEIIPNIETIKKEVDKHSLPDSILEKGVPEEKPSWEEGIIVVSQEGQFREKIYIAFFTKAACERCDRSEKMLHYLKKKYPYIVIKIYDALNRDDQKEQEAISIASKVPDKERLVIPTIFICDTFLIRDGITEKNLEKIISENKNRMFLPPWDKGKEYEDLVNEGIAERFKKFGALVVLFAGLVDGVNPCAFATIVFFLSFMTIIGRTRREILVTGITFVVVVFLVYLFIGLFLYRIIGLGFLSPIRRILYYAIAGLAFVLAVISLNDARMLARGRPEKSILRLPSVVKKRIEKIIVKESKLRNYIVVAFISGLVISFLEFSCTGQVYIPTIFFVSGISSLKLKALLFLILYNLAFIVPLFLLFVLFIIGTSSEQLYAFMRKRTFLLKLVTAVIFLILAISLILVK
ncbi:MAG: hypothetical protein E3J41_10590 [Candidatus Cloacimonadota bacterium]|nr:MAG: hypothetical protein E3J41_10590 [Candidatus Cloacimonadota bacterium]